MGWLAVCVIVGILCAVVQVYALFLYLFGALALMAATAVFIYRKSRGSVLISKLVYGYIFIIFTLISYNHMVSYLKPGILEEYIRTKAISEVNIKARVKKIEEKDNYYSVLLEKCTITGMVRTTFQSEALETKNLNSDESKPENRTFLFSENVEGIQLSISQIGEIEINDIVEVSGSLKNLSKPRNTGEFDGYTYYRSIGINYKCSGKEIHVIEKNSNELLRELFVFREKLKDTYNKIAENDAGLYRSVVLGDKQDLSEDIKSMYQQSGIAHLLAISGLHVSMIGMSVFRGFRNRGISYILSAVISGSIVILYGIMTGNGVSAFRAVIMFVIMVVAEVLGRTYDMISALSISAVMLLLGNPMVIFNCGFLLSFLAIIGITLVYPTVRSLMFIDQKNVMFGKSIFHKIADSVLLSFCINLTTLPVILYFYYEVPPYSVFLNIIVIPLMSFVMSGAVLGGIVGLMFESGGIFLLGLAHYILKFYELLCSIYLKIPFALYIVGKPGIMSIIFYSILLLLLVLRHTYSKSAPKKKFILLIPIMIFILVYRKPNELTIHMADVGQGDGILVRTKEGTTYLFDCGSSDIDQIAKFRLVPLLKANAIRKIDYIVVSHADADHISGLLELVQMDTNIQIKNVILPDILDKDKEYEELEQVFAEKGIQIQYASEGVSIGDNTTEIRCIYPYLNLKYTNRNDYSAVYLLKYKDFTMAFMGDLEGRGEKELVDKNWLSQVTVLKTGHHGSDSSSTESFLDIVSPRISLISCGIDNKYGHPHQNTIDKLKKTGSRIFITSELGEIVLRTNGSELSIDYFIK